MRTIVKVRCVSELKQKLNSSSHVIREPLCQGVNLLLFRTGTVEAYVANRRIKSKSATLLPNYCNS